MKKRCLFVGLLAICFMFLLASCDSGAVDITLRGQQTSFVVGDTFTTDGLVVVATVDGTPSTVTTEATIDSSLVDMSKPGTYAVMVTYEGSTVVYTVTVSEPDNTETLVSLQADTTNVKTDYVVGEVFSTTGLSLIATYSNSAHEENTVRYITDLSGFTTVIRNEDAEEVQGVFVSPGKYYAYISSNAVRARIELNVTSGPQTVAQAVELASSRKEFVKSGVSTSDGYIRDDYFSQAQNYEYGEDYMRVNFMYNGDPITEHYSINSDGSGFGIRQNTSRDEANRFLEVLSNVSPSNASGLKYDMFSLGEQYYSPEGLLSGLYEMAVRNINNDFEQSFQQTTTQMGVEEYSYAFSFGYVRYQGQNLYSLNNVSVDFVLGENFILKSLDVNCNTYYKSTDTANTFTIYSKADPTMELTLNSEGKILDNDGTIYLEDQCIARVTAGTQPGRYSNSYSVTQVAGTREIENEFTEDAIFITDYNITLGGNAPTMQDGKYLVSTTAGTRVEYTISNLTPSTATEIDKLTLRMYDPTYGVTVTSDLITITDTVNQETAISIYYSRTNGTLAITASTPGTYEFSIISALTKRDFVVEADYIAPTGITPQLYIPNVDPSLATFQANGGRTSTYVGRTIYFNVKANTYQGDPDFTATCTSANATVAQTSVISLNERVKAYSFTATAPGTYVINISSTRNPSATTKLSVVVKEVPDMTPKLLGSYDIQDINHNAGTIEFAQTSVTSEQILGTATITIGTPGDDVYYHDVVSFTYSLGVLSNVASTSEGTNESRASLIINDNYEIVLSFSFNNGASMNEGLILSRAD